MMERQADDFSSQSDLNNQSDSHDLWVQLQHGDSEALRQVLNGYTARLTDQARRVLAHEDDVQEAVQEIVQQMQEQWPRAGVAPTHAGVEAWLLEHSARYLAQRQPVASVDADPPAHDEAAEETGWVQQTLTGDQTAFTYLVERYYRAVYTHVYYQLHNAHDAEDAVQEIFQRAYTRLETFDTTRRFRSWLLAIASNYCHDFRRRWKTLKRGMQQVALDEVDYWLADTGANPEKHNLRQERRSIVQQAVRQLAPKYRDILILFYWNELTYQEIVDVTGLPESTVKTRLRRARLQLEETLASLNHA